VFAVGISGFPRSVVLIYCFLAPVVMIYSRRLIAGLLGERWPSISVRSRIPTVIFGADSMGAELFESLNARRNRKIVAFAENDASLIGGQLAGRKVVAVDSLPDLIHYHGVREIFIAKKRFSRADHRYLTEFLHPYPVTIKTIPGLDELASGEVEISASRPVRVEDLLGRDPVQPREELMTKAVAGKAVLVTGAGGSIGSEIVRQVQRFNPKRLILLDNNEFALFEIHREMEALVGPSGYAVEVKAVLGSVLDASFLLNVMIQFGIEVVFHAAAYKHVRMVQENVAAGVNNNIFGTNVAAQVAIQAQVDLFVLVSTDKAVRPTSVMGATKRVAEMILQGLGREQRTKTTFASVRFGNVLGSSGSVVPLFQQQIDRGGPVTVTHPDVTRYFMLIPEAAQLVIQAAAMARGGDVFVLDMGEPVKIVDLARTMIEVAGPQLHDEANPEGDIEIKFVGLRDGEKLFEELLIGENVSTTAHDRIMRCDEYFPPRQYIEMELEVLRRSLEVGDAEDLIRRVMLLATPPKLPALITPGNRMSALVPQFSAGPQAK